MRFSLPSTALHFSLQSIDYSLASGLFLATVVGQVRLWACPDLYFCSILVQEHAKLTATAGILASVSFDYNRRKGSLDCSFSSFELSSSASVRAKSKIQLKKQKNNEKPSKKDKRNSPIKDLYVHVNGCLLLMMVVVKNKKKTQNFSATVTKKDYPSIDLTSRLSDCNKRGVLKL